MSWIILVCSGLLEGVWATALSKSENFTKLVPSLIFLVGLVASMAGLAYALRELSVGTAYAVWVGIGTVATISWAAITGAETLTVTKVVLLAVLVGAIVGLKVTSH